jgi:hypothetical protein
MIKKRLCLSDVTTGLIGYQVAGHHNPGLNGAGFSWLRYHVHLDSMYKLIKDGLDLRVNIVSRNETEPELVTHNTNKRLF